MNELIYFDDIESMHVIYFLLCWKKLNAKRNCWEFRLFCSKLLEKLCYNVFSLLGKLSLPVTECMYFDMAFLCTHMYACILLLQKVLTVHFKWSENKPMICYKVCSSHFWGSGTQGPGVSLIFCGWSEVQAPSPSVWPQSLCSPSEMRCRLCYAIRRALSIILTM